MNSPPRKEKNDNPEAVLGRKRMKEMEGKSCLVWDSKKLCTHEGDMGGLEEEEIDSFPFL